MCHPDHIWWVTLVVTSIEYDRPFPAVALMPFSGCNIDGPPFEGTTRSDAAESNIGSLSYSTPLSALVIEPLIVKQSVFSMASHTSVMIASITATTATITAPTTVSESAVRSAMYSNWAITSASASLNSALNAVTPWSTI